MKDNFFLHRPPEHRALIQEARKSAVLPSTFSDSRAIGLPRITNFVSNAQGSQKLFPSSMFSHQLYKQGPTLPTFANEACTWAHHVPYQFSINSDSLLTLCRTKAKTPFDRPTKLFCTPYSQQSKYRFETCLCHPLLDLSIIDMIMPTLQ